MKQRIRSVRWRKGRKKTPRKSKKSKRGSEKMSGKGTLGQFET